MISAQDMGRVWAIFLGLVAVGAAGGWTAYQSCPLVLELVPAPILPVCEISSAGTKVRFPQYPLLARTVTYKDELLAYLHFGYVRTQPGVQESDVLLTIHDVDRHPVYEIAFTFDDFLTAHAVLGRLYSAGLISGFDVWFTDPEIVRTSRQQTRLFVAAYNFPVRRQLEHLGEREIMAAVQRFILFKSRTDRRIRKGIEPVPEPLTTDTARQLASDIVTVARFFDLPLDLFLGVGAIENNYMDARGDLTHAVWKRRAEKGDIILKRRRGRVLVLNYSSGVWQITRETLRRAHRYFLEDHRDYSVLPEHLRPTRELDLDLDLEHSSVLTTYAGLLLRKLLDHFHGDTEKALGAYNGGIKSPNLEYASGAQQIAAYARRIIEQVAALHGRSVIETPFIAPPRR